MEKELKSGKLNKVLEVAQFVLIVGYSIFDILTSYGVFATVCDFLFIGILLVTIIADRFLNKKHFWIINIVGSVLGIISFFSHIEFIHLFRIYYGFISISMTIKIVLLLAIIGIGIALTVLRFKPVQTKSERIAELEAKVKELEETQISEDSNNG